MSGTTKPKLQVLDNKTLTRSYSLKHLRNCPMCKERFKIGMSVVTKRGGSHRKWYHLECAKKVNIWWIDRNE